MWTFLLVCFKSLPEKLSLSNVCFFVFQYHKLCLTCAHSAYCSRAHAHACAPQSHVVQVTSIWEYQELIKSSRNVSTFELTGNVSLTETQIIVYNKK